MSIYAEVLASISSQRSKGWHDVRVGRFTASQIWKLFVEPKTKAAKDAGEMGETAKTYIKTKVAETLTGLEHRAYSASLNWGEENEEAGLNYFSEKMGIKIKGSAFVPYGKDAGGTPDADCIDENSIVELKCPYDSSNMIDYLRLRKQEDLWLLNKDYWWQCQSNMLFSKADKCYFAAYDPRMSEPIRLHVIELFKDEVAHDKINDVIDKAAKEKERILTQVLIGMDELTASLNESLKQEYQNSRHQTT